MSHHLRASLLLTIAVALTIAVNVLYQPEPVPDAQRNDEMRATLVIQYLAFKGGEIGDYPALKRYLVDFVEREDYDLEFVKTAALIAGIEGDDVYANELLACLSPDDPHQAMLDYALGYGGYLPEAWESYISSNWFGMRLGALIYQRLGAQDDYIDYLPLLRQMENDAAQFGNIQSLFYIAGMIGLGLILSMFFSARFFKRYGYPYFLLASLKLKRTILYEFVALVLFAALVVAALAALLPASLPVIWQMCAFYLGFVAVVTLIVRHFLFKGKKANKIAKILGLHNQRMRPAMLFHILGGFLMCIGVYLLTVHLQTLFWPYDRLMQLDVPKIMNNPLHASVFVALSCVIAPIFEEIIFRGLVFRGTLSTTPAWVAVLFSAFLFALPHALPAWPVTFMLGIVLALIYYRTGNLLVCIWTHAAWNILVLVFSMSHISL